MAIANITGPLQLWFWLAMASCWLFTVALFCLAIFLRSNLRRHTLFFAATALLAVPLVGVMMNWSEIAAASKEISLIRLPFQLGVQVVGISLSLGLFSLLYRLWNRHAFSSFGIVNTVAIVLLTGFWSVANLYAQLTPNFYEMAGDDSSFKLVTDCTAAAFTDKGTVVQLFRCQPVDETVVAKPTDRDYGFEDRVMRLSYATTQANCHGWVFTEGKFLLCGNDVQKILADHLYSRTSKPVAGDVIIYRDAMGNILHTGLVRFLNEKGEPFIESKWGIQGHFLHRPQDQIYSQYYSYYHTERSSHLISVSKPLQSDVAASDWAGISSSRDSQKANQVAIGISTMLPGATSHVQ